MVDQPPVCGKGVLRTPMVARHDPVCGAPDSGPVIGSREGEAPGAGRMQYAPYAMNLNVARGRLHVLSEPYCG